MPFTFVDAGASDSRVNHHKIRKHLRAVQASQQRQRHILKQKHVAELRSTSIVAAGLLTWSIKAEEKHGEVPCDISEKRGTSKPEVSTSQTHNLPRSQDQAAVQLSAVPPRRYPVSPVSFLSPGRTDPFSTQPIPVDATTDASIHFFAYDFGPYLYGYTRNESYDVIRHRGFCIAAQDPAAFHANMFLASIHLDMLNGRSLPGMRALAHRVQAIRLINERLSTSTEFLTEGTIYTLVVMTCLSHVWGAIRHDEVPDGELTRILIACGGLGALRKYPLLEHIMYSCMLISSRFISFDDPELYSHHGGLYNSPEDVRRAMAAEFIDFLQSTMLPAYAWPLSMIAFAIQPGSPLREALTSHEQDQSNSPTRHSCDAAERSALGTLLHMHCKLMGPHEQADGFSIVDRLNDLNRHAWIWRNGPTMAHYMIVKAEDSAGLEDACLSWRVLRLVETCCMLSIETYAGVKHHLLALFSGPGHYQTLDLDTIQNDLHACCWAGNAV